MCPDKLGDGFGRDGRVQIFEGFVVARQPGNRAGVLARPIAAMLAEDSPSAYWHVGLPPVLPETTTAATRHWLTKPASTRF